MECAEDAFRVRPTLFLLQPQSLIDELLLYKRSEDQIELKEKQLSTMRVDVCSTETLKCLKGKDAANRKTRRDPGRRTWNCQGRSVLLSLRQKSNSKIFTKQEPETFMNSKLVVQTRRYGAQRKQKSGFWAVQTCPRVVKTCRAPSIISDLVV